MDKKHIIVAGIAFVLIAVSAYIYYYSDPGSDASLVEVDFSTMDQADIDTMVGVKARMNAASPEEQVPGQE